MGKEKMQDAPASFKHRGPEGEGWKNATSGLPPFFNMGIGDILQGILEKVEIREKVKKDKKGQPLKDSEGQLITVDRYYYTIRLNQDAEATGGKHGDVEFASGDVVTLSGSGQLDNAVAKEAYLLAGHKEEDFDPDTVEVDYKALYGREIFIQRCPKEEIKKGEWAGKLANRFTFQHREAVKEAVAA